MNYFPINFQPKKSPKGIIIIAIILLILFIYIIARADIFYDYQTQIVTIERNLEIENFIKNMPFLQLLDEYLDLTSGITFYKVKDTKTNEEYDLFNIPWEDNEIRMRKKFEDNIYWFKNLDEKIWWRCGISSCKEKIYKND